jgi:hypothetical protein
VCSIRVECQFDRAARLAERTNANVTTHGPHLLHATSMSASSILTECMGTLHPTAVVRNMPIREYHSLKLSAGEKSNIFQFRCRLTVLLSGRSHPQVLFPGSSLLSQPYPFRRPLHVRMTSPPTSSDFHISTGVVLHGL